MDNVRWDKPLNANYRKLVTAYAEEAADFALQRGEAYDALRMARQLRMAQPNIKRHRELLERAESTIQAAQAVLNQGISLATPEQMQKMGAAHVALGNFVDAAAYFLEWAKQQPTNIGAFVWFAWCMMRAGDYEKARQIVGRIPPEAQNAMSVAIPAHIAVAESQFAVAADLMNKAQHHYADAAIWMPYGAGIGKYPLINDIALITQGHYEAFANAIHLFAPAKLMTDRKFAEALAEVETVLKEIPDDLSARDFKYVCLMQLNRKAEALEVRFGRKFGSGGTTLAEAGRMVPHLWQMGFYSAAYTLGKAVLETFPDNIGLMVNTAHSAAHAALFEEFQALLDRLRADMPKSQHHYGVLIFPLLSLLDDPKLQYDVARYYVKNFDPGNLPTVNTTTRALSGGKIRIAYLSCDYHNHATLHLLTEVIELTDRSKFKIYAYSYDMAAEDDARRRLMRAVDKFVDMSQMTTEDIVDRTQQDGIHILVDLKGYTQDARLEMLPFKAAPIQVAWLGYPGTSGMPAMDYFIGDHIATPKGYGQYFSEKIVRLPNSYQPNDRKRKVAAIPSRKDVGLPEDAVVFCSFNQIYKILPEVFDCWMEILKAVPHSVLAVIAFVPEPIENMRMRAEKMGVNPDRLIFWGMAPNPAHLARYGVVDLALDTWPVCSHTTGSDALWVGCPQLTLTGKSFASRVSASLVHAVGLPELQCNSLEEYKEKAIALGNNPQKLKELRAYLEKGRHDFPLFDAARYARNLGRAYEIMYQKWLKGEAAAEIDVVEA